MDGRSRSLKCISEDGGATHKEYFSVYPIGYQFCPSDEELVLYYLLRKVNDFTLYPHQIPHIDFYKKEPSVLAEEYEPLLDAWYFFTPREKKYPNGKRPNRAAGNGFWKPTGTEKSIMIMDRPVAKKKTLDFYEGKHPSGTRSDWKMHEFVINDLCIPATPTTERDAADAMQLNDCVLCKLYKTPVRRDQLQ